MAKSKLAKYKKRRRATASNPSEVTDTAVNVGAGFAGYAATRLVSRIAYSQAVKRSPKASNYVHLAASALGAVGVYFGSKHVEKTSKYHEAAAIGAGIALGQAALQTFAPKFGWIVSDVNEEQYAKKQPKKQLPSANLNDLLPPDDSMALPEATGGVGEGEFDLDQLLAADDSIEAVAIGQDEPMESEHRMLEDFGDDLDQYSGMMN